MRYVRVTDSLLLDHVKSLNGFLGLTDAECRLAADLLAETSNGAGKVTYVVIADLKRYRGWRSGVLERVLGGLSSKGMVRLVEGDYVIVEGLRPVIVDGVISNTFELRQL